MATIRIQNETFEVVGVNAEGREIGTVYVCIGRSSPVKTQAHVTFRGDISVAGFVGRYLTSQKPWLAHVSGTQDQLRVNFGRDDRSGRFNKRNAISFEPETYAALCNPEFWQVV